MSRFPSVCFIVPGLALCAQRLAQVSQEERKDEGYQSQGEARERTGKSHAKFLQRPFGFFIDLRNTAQDKEGNTSDLFALGDGNEGMS